MKRVVVGLSGGVDSSVAVHLLLQQGYEVIGMFMRNWHDESVTISDDCPWLDDANDALLVAEHFGIPFQVIDLSKSYKERIVDYMFHEYARGRTPNPDVLCNREIKFDVFLDAAMQLGADFVATGHYCRKRNNEDGSVSLLKGKDPNKDQSYFLCQVTQDQLQKVLFPIGELLKSEVRSIADELSLVNAQKKDSQGLCFVGKIRLPEFLQQQLAARKGTVIEVNPHLEQFSHYRQLPKAADYVVELSRPFLFDKKSGIEVASHNGAHFYTVGQRRGLHIGGRPMPSFVIGIDTNENIVYTGQSEEHPGLNRIALKIDNKSINWINRKYQLTKESELKCQIRIRYRQPLQEGTLLLKDGVHYILFEEYQKGITPGQFASWYIEEELIGSGVIQH
jgi:tRNA-specific 2-thiouridylase